MVYVNKILFVIKQIKLRKKAFVLKVRIEFFSKRKIRKSPFFLACLKFQCLMVIKNNKTTCECANRRAPCDKNLHIDTKDNCENQSTDQIKHSSTFLKTSDGKYPSIYASLLTLFCFS
jgi:hypothetical protein